MTHSHKVPNEIRPFVAYYRVSTQQQGLSGLGLEAQKAAVLNFLNGGTWELVGEFTEIESGKRDDRRQLRAALAKCQALKATLVVAKLDRLARKVSFVAALMDSGVPFVVVDNPHAGPFELHIRAAVDEEERRRISERTKSALAAAKARGVELGRQGKEFGRLARQQAIDLTPAVRGIRKSGKTSVRQIMEELNERGIRTLRGGRWHPHTTNLLLHRIDSRATARRRSSAGPPVSRPA